MYVLYSQGFMAIESHTATAVFLWVGGYYMSNGLCMYLADQTTLASFPGQGDCQLHILMPPLVGA